MSILKIQTEILRSSAFQPHRFPSCFTALVDVQVIPMGFAPPGRPHASSAAAPGGGTVTYRMGGAVCGVVQLRDVLYLRSNVVQYGKDIRILCNVFFHLAGVEV